MVHSRLHLVAGGDLRIAVVRACRNMYATVCVARSDTSRESLLCSAALSKTAATRSPNCTVL